MQRRGGAGATTTSCRAGARLADLMHSLDLSVLSRLAIGRHIRTEYMLPPEEVGQRFAGGLTRLQACRASPSAIASSAATINWPPVSRRGWVIGCDWRRRCSRSTSTVTDRGEVTLTTGEVIAAATIVAAVPLPVLSRIWPAMPLELGAIGYGVGGKISVQFDRRIWRDYGRNGEVMTERAWGHLWETTDDQSGDRGVLTNLLSSHDGAAFAALPEAPDRIVAEIDRLFPGAKGLAGERVHTDWTNDPFSLGAYAASAPVRSPPLSRCCTRPTVATAACCSPASTPTSSAASWKAPCAAAPESPPRSPVAPR